MEATPEATDAPAGVAAAPAATFEKNQLVWVKWIGFPWWPGRVRRRGAPSRP